MACTTVVCGRVLTTNVLLRVAALALAIVDILLARFGGHNGYTLNLPQNEKWLVIIASGGYVIILGAMVGSYLRGQQVPQFLEYVFICVGAALFLAGGGTAIDFYSNYSSRYSNEKSAGLALAVCLLATGATMAVDFGFMIFNCR